MITSTRKLKTLNKQKSSTLARYIWRKQLGPNPNNIKLEILKTSETYKTGQNM